MPNTYRGSQAQETIVVLRTVSTTTTIGAFGSDDGYSTPRTEFGDDETIMLAGSVVATDKKDLTGTQITINVDRTLRGTTPLYGFDGTLNFFQISIGTLAEGTHLVEAVFPRTRK